MRPIPCACGRHPSERACLREAREGRRRSACVVCGASLEGRQASATVCSRSCYTRTPKYRELDRRIAARTREEKRARQRDYAARNPEKVAANKLEWSRRDRARNPEKYAELRRRARERNPDAHRAYHAAWVARNPEKVAELNERTRVRRRGAQVVDRIPLLELWERELGVCYLCGEDVPRPTGRRIPAGPEHRRQATREHVVPIIRDGVHSWANVRLAHKSCNSRKGARLPEELVAA